MNAVPVIALDHPAALDAARVGHDAAALATARAAGLPVGPGVVLTAGWSSDDVDTTELVWRIVSHDGAISLTVRPSPVGSSALDAPRAVRSAADLLSAAHEARAGHEPDVPVLVQADVRDDWRGVLMVDGGDAGWLQRLHTVSSDRGWIAELDGAGRVRRVLAGRQLDHPPVEVLARLSRLAERLAAVLDGTGSFDFAVDEGRVRALHVRRSATAATVTGDLFETAA